MPPNNSIELFKRRVAFIIFSDHRDVSVPFYRMRAGNRARPQHLWTGKTDVLSVPTAGAGRKPSLVPNKGQKSTETTDSRAPQHAMKPSFLTLTS